MLTFIGRKQTINVAVENHRLEFSIAGHGFATKTPIGFAELREIHVETKLSHAGHIDAKFEIGLLVPICHVRSHGLEGEEFRQAPLNVDALVGIGVVRAPKFGEIAQRFVVAAGPAAGTQHHGHARILCCNALQHLIQTTHVIDIQIALALAERRRIDVGDRAVAVPFEVSHLRMVGENGINHAKNMVLHGGIGQIEHQLVTIIIGFAVGLPNDPIGMTLKQFALRIDHLGFDPDTEFHARFFGVARESGDALRQLLAIHRPISQTGPVVIARILVGEPSVVEQKEIHPELFGLSHEGGEFFPVEIKAGVLPIVEQREAIAHAVLELIAARPVLQMTRGRSHSATAERKDELRSDKNTIRRQRVGRCVGVDAGQETQHAGVVYLERTTEVSGPSHGAEQDPALVFARFGVESQFKEGLRLHGCSRSEMGVDHFLSKLQLLCGRLGFFCPVAVIVGEKVARGVKIEHGASHTVEDNGLRLGVCDLTPGFDDILLGVGSIVQDDLQRISVVAKRNEGLRSAINGLLPMILVIKIGRFVAICVRNAERRFEKVLCSPRGVGFETAHGVTSVRTGSHLPIQPAGIFKMTQFFAEIHLVKTAGRANFQHQIRFVGRDADERIGRGGSLRHPSTTEQ